MGFIKFKQYYTELVEHFFRMSVRYERVSKTSSQHWFLFTKEWIDKQSEEDKNFIRFVFDYQFYSTAEGLHCFKSTDDMHLKRGRLAALERQFALESGLIGDNGNEDRTGDTRLSK